MQKSKAQLAAALAATLGFALHGAVRAADPVSDTGIGGTSTPIAEKTETKSTKKIKNGKSTTKSKTECKGKESGCKGTESGCAGKTKTKTKTETKTESK